MSEAAEPAPTPAPAPSLRRTLIKSAMQFSGATAVSQAAGTVGTWLAAFLLGPPVFGIWLGMRLIVDYGQLLHLGSIFGMHRNLPVLRGRGDEAAIAEVKRTVFSFALTTAGIGALATAVVSSFWPRPSERPILLALVAVLFTNQVKAYYVTLFKAQNRFRESSTSLLIGAVAALASIPLIWAAGLGGFVAGLALQAACETGYLVVRSEVPRLEIRFRVLRQQLGIGLVMTLIVFGTTLLTSIDRTVILEKLDSTHLGYYGIAFLLTTFMTGVAGVPAAILYPRLSEQYGRTGRPADLAPLVIEPLRVLSVGFAVISGALALALPPAVHLLLPKYAPGVSAARLSLVGIYCYVVVFVAQMAFYTLNWQKLFLGVLLGSAAASYGLARLFVGIVPGLGAVAAGCSAGLVVFMVTTILLAFLIMERPGSEGARALGTTAAPLLGATALVVGIDALLGRLLPSTSVARAAMAEAVFLVACAPFVWRVMRRALGRR